MTKHIQKGTAIKRIAQTGLVAKGIVYCTLGILAFMAAFEIGGQTDADANRKGVFNFIKEAPAGTWLLLVVTAGLICYCLWRGIQAFTGKKEEIKWPKRLRYLLSGFTYAAVAATAIKILLGDGSGKGDRNQKLSAQMLDKPFGQWGLGIAALIMASMGIYQIWYGLSKKYKKHVQQLNTQSFSSSILLHFGKAGYVARGIVWLILAYLLLRAAVHANAKEAGDTGKAFQFVEASAMGSFLMAALGLGLIMYGVFNFVRARYEKLD